MRLLTEQQQQQVADAITAVEQRTDAELVAVVAAHSDDYRYIPTLWAALVALLTPIPLLLFGNHQWDVIYLVQLFVFFICAWVFQRKFLQSKLIPQTVRHWRASNMARRQFLEQELHHTKAETGLLIFVSEAEHYVEILADRGISRHIDNQQWQSIVDSFIEKLKTGDTLKGFLDCIHECGTLLEKHVPASTEKNEISNRLVVL